MSMGDGAAGILAIVHEVQQAPYPGVSCCLPNHSKWESHEKGASVGGQKSEETGSQEQLLTVGAVDPFPGSFPRPRCSQGCRRWVPDSCGGLTTDRTCKHGRAGGRSLVFFLPLKRCKKRASAGWGPRRSSAPTLPLRSKLSPGVFS